MAISYVSGGKLGDFIQQLSVIYEKFLMDGKHAILYLSDRGDSFRHGIQQAYTDLQPLISRQSYIQEFKIHQGEPYDVDLSSWRRHIGQTTPENFVMWIKKEYGVDWGKHPWLCNIPNDPKWKDKVVVNTTHYRFPDSDKWISNLRSYPKDKLVFVGFDAAEYHDFVRRTRLKIHFHRPASLWDFVVILHSCLFFTGSLSMPLSVAFGLSTPCEIGFVVSNEYEYNIFQNLQQNMKKKVCIQPSVFLKQQKKMPPRLQKYIRLT